MSDTKPQTESRPTPAGQSKEQQAGELDHEKLDQVTGGTGSTDPGAGKIKFNEFTIKKTTDIASP